MVPNPLDWPTGCRFRDRCARADARCAEQQPPLVEIEAHHRVACFMGREMALLEIRDLKKYFPVQAGLLRRGAEHVKAIDGVSLDVEDGETVGLVGESGCGKTTLGRCLVRLIEPSGGHHHLRGQRAIRPCPGRRCARCAARCRSSSGPYASLNPRMRIGEIIGEGLRSTAWPRAAIARSGCWSC